MSVGQDDTNIQYFGDLHIQRALLCDERADQELLGKVGSTHAFLNCTCGFLIGLFFDSTYNTGLIEPGVKLHAAHGGHCDSFSYATDFLSEQGCKP